MKVILLENLAKIGSIGEIIEVKRGFARNYLISNKKALYASKDQDKKKSAKQIYESLKNKTYEVKKLTTENKDLYGSIKPTEISKIINQQDKIDVKPSLIQPLNEIKTLGSFKVKINLHSEVQVEIIIKVVSEDNIK